MEPGLKRRLKEVRPEFPDDEKCVYHPTRKGIPVEKVAEIIDPVFRQQFGLSEYNSQFEEQDGESLELVVSELAEPIDDEISQLIANQLIEDEDVWPQDGEEPFYSDVENYVELRHLYDYHGELWENFCKSIVHEQRFFNSNAFDLVSQIFSGIQYQRDNQTLPAIYKIEPSDSNSSFYRARTARSVDKIDQIRTDPEKQLGPPPERLRKAGRMNPAGISCFYGAFDFDTCIAELRPSVGVNIVGAKFQLVRPIYVLDTTRFERPMKTLSLFSQNYVDRVEQWTFMRQFRREIAKPISRDDEHLDYIPTQAVAEYLLNYFQFKRSGNEAKIEAIIFQSAQSPTGKNIVLLGDAGQLQTNATLAAKLRKGAHSKISSPLSLDLYSRGNTTSLNPAIELVPQSVEVRWVTGANFQSKKRPDPEFD